MIAGCFVPALLLQRRGHPGRRRRGHHLRHALLWRRHRTGRSDVSFAGRLAGRRDAGRDRWSGRGGLTGKNGPLVIAFVAMASWSCGRIDGWHMARNPLAFLLLFVPGVLLALGRDNRLLAHAAILALSVWLGALLMPQAGAKILLSAWLMGGSRSRQPISRSACWRWSADWPALSRRCCHGGAGFSGSCSALKSAWLWKSRVGHRMPSLSHVYPAYGRGAGRWRRSRCWRGNGTRAGSSSSRPVPSA